MRILLARDAAQPFGEGPRTLVGLVLADTVDNDYGLLNDRGSTRELLHVTTSTIFH